MTARARKRTPGPWILATVATSAGSVHKIGAFPTGDTRRPYTYACIYADGLRPGIDDECPAAIELAGNARLMAAAPDLLEALQLLIHEVDESAVAGATDFGWKAATDKTRAAIAKATGAAS